MPSVAVNSADERLALQHVGEHLRTVDILKGFDLDGDKGLATLVDTWPRL